MALIKDPEIVMHNSTVGYSGGVINLSPVTIPGWAYATIYFVNGADAPSVPPVVQLRYAYREVNSGTPAFITLVPVQGPVNDNEPMSIGPIPIPEGAYYVDGTISRGTDGDPVEIQVRLAKVNA
jgi:hypothetical protein